MNQIPIWVGFVLLGLGLLVLLLGFRGRRIDREPRCPRRRCRYALGDVLAARSERNEAPFPLVCPECGRTILQQSSLRVGTRKKTKTLVVVGVLLLAPGAAVLGFEAYAAYQSTKAVQTMPLWLLLRNAERNTAANRFVHQQELVARASAGKFDARIAHAVIERILKWQADPTVNVFYAGDAVAELALQGFVTDEQAQRFWDQYYQFELVMPPTVAADGPLPFTIRTHARVGPRGGPIPEPSPWAGRYGSSEFLLGWETGLIIERIVTNGRELPPNKHFDRVRQVMRRMNVFGQIDYAWLTTSDAWEYMRAPPGNPGEIVEVVVEGRWVWAGAHQRGSMIDAQTGQYASRDTWLKNRGITVGGVFSLRGATRLAAPGSGDIERVRDPVTDALIRADMGAAHIEVIHQPNGGLSVYLSAGAINRDRTLTDPPVIFADQELRFGDWSWPLRPREVHPYATGIVYGQIDRPEIRQMIAHIAMENPNGWSLALIPRPERAMLTAERPAAWAGDPIIVPLNTSLDWRCRDQPPDPKIGD